MDKKQDLVIFEFDYHSEVLLNSLRILTTLNYNIYLFTTTEIWSRISSAEELTQITVFDTPNQRKVKSLILKNLQIINTSQAIIFNTLASHFKLFCSLNFKPPVILRIHNANTYLNPIKSINPKISFFYIWKDASYLLIHGLLKMELFYRPKFIKEKVNYFLFPSNSIKDYVVKQGYLKPEKILPSVPYVFMKKEIQSETEKTSVSIVVIGGIDKRRRNYNEVLNSFSLLVPNLKTQVTFSLLGKPYGFYGKKINKKFKNLETKLFKVNTFEKFVPQPIFNKITGQADFLIIPTIKETRYKLYKELYGYTKISGSVNDMVIYKKPALIPSFYPIDIALKPHVKTYENEKELSSILENWIEKKEFERRSITSVIEAFDFEHVAQTTFEGLEGIRK